MNRLATSSGLLATAALACVAQTQAATRTTDLDSAGSAMGVTAHGCLQQLTTSVSEGENCMYDGGMVVYEFPAGSGSFPANPFGEATGPFSQAQYYDSTTTPQAFAANFVPAPADGKIQQVINGTVTIDDNGNGFGADDLVSFNITMTSPGGGNIIRNIGSDVADQYTSMTQVLAPTLVSSATPNGSGGFDYVIGSEGFPLLLTFTDATADGGACVGQTFGDMECDAGFDVNMRTDPLRWSPWAPTDQSTFAGQFPVPHVGPPQSAGLGSLEGNFGARTTGTVVNLTCADDGVTAPTGSPPGSTFCTAGKTSFNPIVNGPNQAPAGGNGAEDVGWDQLVLKVSTDAFGNVLSAEGFDVQEYMIFGPPGLCGSDNGATNLCNTWLAGHFALTGNVPGAVDDADQTLRDNPVTIDVLANDMGFVDDVTVSLSGGGTSANGGTVVINGANPGPQAGIDVTYTPAPGFVGSDTFDYTVVEESGTGNAGSAMVTVQVLDIGANADTASTRLNTTAPGIPVGMNDFGFTDPVTVVITVPPDMGGDPPVINGSGGPMADVTIDFTPVAPLGTATYTETFTYQVTDAAMVVDTAVVSVTVNNRLPAAVDANASAAEGGTASTDVAALAGVDLGDPPSVISEAAAPTNGTTSVAGNVITYTPNGFFTGNDSFDYTITDVDGETSTANVAVTIGPKLVPTAVADTAAVDQGGSVPIDVTGNDIAGSGTLANHTVAVTSNPSNGTATVGGGNVVTYAPAASFSGVDSFQYTLTDVDGDTSVTTVSVTVNPTGGPGPAPPTFPELPSASAIDPYTLALLMLVPYLRHRQRQRKSR